MLSPRVQNYVNYNTCFVCTHGAKIYANAVHDNFPNLNFITRLIKSRKENQFDKV